MLFLKQNQISKKCSQWIPKFRGRRWLPLLIIPVGACISATDPWSPTTNDTRQALTGRDVPSSWEVAANGQFTWNPTVTANAQAKAQKHIAVSPDGAFYLHAEGKSSSKLFVSPLELNDEMVTSRDDVDFGDFGAAGRKLLNAKLDSSLQPAEKYTLGGLGAVSFDPRHGLGPIRVANDTKCESTADAAAIHSPNGPYDCYRMLVYSQIRDTSKTPQEYHIAIAPMHLTLERATHTIKKAAFGADFKRILQSDGHYVKARQNSKDEFSDHFTATADGRLLVFDTAPRYTWSADPLATVEPSPSSVKFEIPASFWSVTDAERSRLVRLSDPVSTTACVDAGNDCTRFDQAYPVFRNEYKFVDGTPMASTGAGCGYPWITPDGTDLFCNAGDIAALAMIGQSTRGTFQHIDARVQTTQQRYCQKTEADASCSELPPDAGLDACSPRGTAGHGCGGDAGTTLGTQRITAIGAATGPWRIRGPGGHTTRFPLMHRAPSLMMMSRNTALKAFADNTDARDDSFLYFEVATDAATDPDFVAFFHMNEAIVPITSSSSPSSWEARAPFGDTNPAEGARATRTADAAGHGYVGTLKDCAQFPFDRFGHVEHPNDAPPNPGFFGRAVYFALPTSKIEFESKGPYDRLREARTTMTLELAVRARNLDANAGKTVLVAAKDSFELSFDPSDEDSVTFAATGASAARFPNVPIKTRGEYVHLGVTYQGGPGANQATVSLFVDGALHVDGNALVTGAGSLPIPTGPHPLCIGPGCGSSTECSPNVDPLRPELLIDEVGISSVIRSNEYMAAAALETGPMDVFSPNDPPAWFDPLPEGLDAKDIRIPNAILDVADAAADPQEQFHRVAELGRALFKDDVLSVDKPDCGGRTPGHACSTCHDPDNFFAHPDAGFDKDIHDAALDTNTPSLIGRAFSTRQLMDRSEASLLHQAARVIEDPREMGGKLTRIVGCLNRGDPLEGEAAAAAPNGIWTYKQWFGYAYPGTTSVTKERLLGAIATYELRLNSGDSGVDRMLLTDAGIPASDAGSVELGFRLFQGKGRCAGCHAGSNFTDELRHVTSVGGKAVKTPTLRNVSRTPPYFHDATKGDLKAVIEHYNRCGAVDSNGACAPELVALGLTVDEINALIAFLEGLDGTSP